MKALFAGSFDPPHLGHLNLIRRASALVSDLIVAVAINPEKPGCLTIAQRLEFLRAACRDLGNVAICSYGGATVTFARSRGVDILMRGVRNAQDLHGEQAMAEVNRANGIDTLLIPSASAYIHVSSSLVKQVAAAGLPLTALVSADVAAAMCAQPNS
jgi:pantetheine-phosphate adenylyltransferase